MFEQNQPKNNNSLLLLSESKEIQNQRKTRPLRYWFILYINFLRAITTFEEGME